ncbi:MAG: hypothetical protein GXZ07_03015 [Firmicutes bacterium]|nr:hypothetical protein [Bacillota bacterium]
MINCLKKSRIAVVFIILALFVSGCIGGSVADQSGKTESGSPDGQNEQAQENEMDNGFEITADFDLSNLPEGEVLEERFSAEEAACRTEQIIDALKSFRLLTEKAAGKISKEEMDDVGNTGWEIQHLGFHNWTNTVLGTLLLQEYEIKKLELELAGEKLEAGKIDKKDLEEKEAAYMEAKNKFQQFLDSYSIAD